MEIVIKRYTSLQRALNTLDNACVILKNPAYASLYEQLRDSAIKRFEYTIDAFWKFLKLYMQEILKVDTDASSPRAILQKSFDIGIIDKDTHLLLLECIASRNLTSHSYDENLAEEIVQNIPRYYSIMRTVFDSLNVLE